ncbi:MAG: condensation domain-containing protein, partial [Methanococcaceae archaeon]
QTVTGPVMLTPVQHWFFEQNFAHPNHWNQSVLLEINNPIELYKLEKIFKLLIRQHDALRIRFQKEDLNWQQFNYDEDIENCLIEYIKIESTEAKNLSEWIEYEANQFQGRLNITSGPLIGVLYMDTGETSAHRLLIIIHHLLTDGVSWGIILEDLQYFYSNYENIDNMKLLVKSTSYSFWANELVRISQSNEVLNEYGHWANIIKQGNTSLPADFFSDEAIEETADSIVIDLTAVSTKKLLKEAVLNFQAQPNEIVLAVLGKVLLQWAEISNMIITIEGHGREVLSQNMDLTRTVGWFTSIYPLLIRNEDDDVQLLIDGIKKQLQSFPNYGTGYGMLRYLGQIDEQSKANLEYKNQVLFNYWGQIDQLFQKSEIFKMGKESRGYERSSKNKIPFLLEVNGGISNGHLHLEWTYSKAKLKYQTVKVLTDSFINELEKVISRERTKDKVYDVNELSKFGWEKSEIDNILTLINQSGEIN